MAKMQSEMEYTPLTLAYLVWFIDKAVPPKHKISLHHLRADVYYSSGDVKYCRHVSPSHRSTTSVQVDGKSRGAC